MSRDRLGIFMEMVKKANPQFKEEGSCLVPLLAEMRKQIAIADYSPWDLKGSIQRVRGHADGAKYEAALRFVERVWGQHQIEYRGPYEETFRPYYMALNDTIAWKGKPLIFRHVDTGEQKEVTFPVCSASNDIAGQVHATVRFSRAAYLVTVLVFDIDIECGFADNFANRSTTALGVNESMNLSFSTTPRGISAQQLGGLKYEIDGDIPANADTARQLKGEMRRSLRDASAPLADGTACFIAPWATDSGFPTNPRPSARTSLVTLRLVFQDGPYAGGGLQRSWDVHTPEGRMVPVRDIHHQGKPSAGFIGEIYFEPKDVSFRYIAWKEGRGTFVAKQTGFKTPPVLRLGSPLPQLPRSPSGYFANFAGTVHRQGPWLSIGAGSAATGSKLNGSDRVNAGINNRWPNKYTAADGAVLSGKDTDAPSEAEWPIFWKYRAVDLAPEVTFQQVKHKSVMERDGKVTMSKAGASVTKSLADPTENG